MELRLPLSEAREVAGLPLSTGLSILRRNPALVLAWRKNRRGKATAIVNPAELEDYAYQGRASVAARFAHRCRRADVNPARVLWVIVSGSRLPDGSVDLDMLGDAMRLALDDNAGGSLFLPKPIGLSLSAATVSEITAASTRFFAGDGRVFLASEFLAVLGGKKVPNGSRAFDIQLADLLLRQSARRGGRMPSGGFAQVWKRLIADVRKNPAWRRSNPVIIRREDGAGGATVRFASVPLYERKLQGAALFFGERRRGDRGNAARDHEAANSKQTAAAANEVAKRIFLPSGRVSRSAGKSLGGAFRAMRSAHPRRGQWHPLPSEVGAAAALEILCDGLGITKQKAWPFLLSYWRRVQADLPPSASAVMAAFQMQSRARTGQGPRHKPKLKRGKLPLRKLADGVCDLFCDATITKEQRATVAEVAWRMMELQQAGRPDSIANLAQQMGFASADAAFFRQYPRHLIDEAAACLDHRDAVPDMRVEDGAADF